MTLCSNCGKNEATEPHECPFAVEVNNDHELCDCCDACTQKCTDDV